MSETLRRIAEARRNGQDPFPPTAIPQQQAAPAPQGWMAAYQQGQMPPPTGAQFSPEDVMSAGADFQQGLDRQAAAQQAAVESHANNEAWLNQQASTVQLQQPEVPVPEAGEGQAAQGRALEAAATQNMNQQAAANQAQMNPALPPEPEVQPPSRGFTGDPRRRGAADQRRANSNSQLRGGWGDAAEAPLPGEETLPGSVAAWNQHRASAGLTGGMDSLRQAYEIEMKNEGMSQTMGLTFEEWLKTKGVTPDLPPMEAGNLLDQLLSQNLSQFPNHGGAGPDPRVDVDDDTILQGRRGVADNTPLDLMTPEQREKIGTHLDGKPRTARGGYHVWDEGAGEAGGFVPRGFDLPAATAAMQGGNIRQAAEILGIDHRAYGDNVAQIEADVHRVATRQQQLSKNYDVAEIPGGGQRLVANDRMKGMMDDRRSNQWGQTMARRYARELKEDGLSIADLQKMHRSYLQQNPGDATGAGAFMNGSYIDGLKARQTQNRWLAVQQHTDQYNRARKYGVSEGMVSFFDSLQNAKTPEERANVLMLAHGSQPGMGWDKMAAMLTRGEIDNDAMAKWAEHMGTSQTPGEKISQQMTRIQQGGIGMDAWAQINNHAASMPGNEKDQNARKAEVRRIATPLIQQHLASGEPLSHDHLAFIRAATQSDPSTPADATVFSQVTGIPQEDPRFVPLYQQVFGAPPSAGIVGNFVQGLQWGAGAVGGGLSAARGFLFGGQQGIDPSAFAGPAAQGK